MKNKQQIFVCGSCGTEYGKWQGKCEGCGEWNTIKEFKVSSRKDKKGNRQTTSPINLNNSDKNTKETIYFSSGISELDKVLGKGIVRGSVILLAGEPGVGKSTLFTQSIGKIGGLYVAGEESSNQVRMRADRLGLDLDNIDVLETNDIDCITSALERTKKLYNLVVVDSIQMMFSPDVSGVAGSVTQIRESTFRLIELAKRNNVAIVIIGHKTKSGDIAGPKLLEHMVDVVLNFEGEKDSQIRLVRVKKNRFGGTDEIGFFKMEENGLNEIGSTKIDLSEGGEGKVGAILAEIVEGGRPILVEVQALVTECFGVSPKRVFRGIDFNRGQLLVAILQKSLNIPLYKYDIYVTVTGGMRVTDPCIDLSIVLAMYSSFKNKPVIDTKKVYIGEVSLLGNVKKVTDLKRREKEISRFGLVVADIREVKEFKQMI